MTVAAALLVLGAFPRHGAVSAMGAPYAASSGSPSGSFRAPGTPRAPAGTKGIQVPRTAWIALAAGGVLARESLRRENADRTAIALDRSFLDGPADVGNTWGSGLTIAAGSAGLLGLGVLANEPSLRNAGKDLGRAFIATSAIVLPMKAFVGRSRPNGAPYSFPSGHTALAFATAPVLSAHFGAKVGVPAYALACFTALGRMEERKHYLSDVVFGGAVGLAVGLTVARRHSSRRTPEFEFTGRGAMITARF